MNKLQTVETRRQKLRMLVVTGMLGAVGGALMYIEFSIPIVPGFLKLDFSELPALIATFTFGPVSGVLVCLIKNLLHLFGSGTMGIGELSNFFIGSIFVIVAGLIYKKHKTRKGALVASLAGSVSMGIVCVFTNYYIVYPLYAKLLMPMEVIMGLYTTLYPGLDNLWKALFAINLPFTAIKGLLVSLICFLIYKKIAPLLRGKV